MSQDLPPFISFDFDPSYYQSVVFSKDSSRSLRMYTYCYCLLKQQQKTAQPLTTGNDDQVKRSLNDLRYSSHCQNLQGGPCMQAKSCSGGYGCSIAVTTLLSSATAPSDNHSSVNLCFDVS